MAFTRVAACLFAEPPEVARCLEGFDGFVTSAAAPIATGWSDQLSGRDLHPLKIRAFPRRTAIGTPMRGPSKATYSVSESDSGRRFTTTRSPRCRSSNHLRHCRRRVV